MRIKWRIDYGWMEMYLVLQIKHPDDINSAAYLKYLHPILRCGAQRGNGNLWTEIGGLKSL